MDRGDTSVDQPMNQPQPDVPVSTKRVARVSHLDGLRALAALWVVLGHMSQTAGRPIAGFFGAGMVQHILDRSDYAVGIFITLSGYVLMLPVLKAGGWFRDGVLGFYKRRVWRILPPYYAVVLVSMLLISTVFTDHIGKMAGSIDYTWKDVVSHFLMVHNFYHPFKINYPLWTIAIEFQIYLLFPIYLLLRKRIGMLSAACLVMVFSIGLRLVCPLSGSDVLAYRPEYIGLFVWGSVAAEIVRGTPVETPFITNIKKGAIYLVVVLGIVSYTVDHRFHELTASGILADYMGPALLIYLGLNHNILRRVLSLRLFTWIGEWSYSLYMVHALVLQAVYLWFISILGVSEGLPLFWNLLVFGLPIILFFCWVFFMLVERWFLPNKMPKFGRSTRIAA